MSNESTTPPAAATPAEDLSRWLGGQERHEDQVGAERLAAMAATLDLETPPDELPPGWHWLFFNPFARASDLGPDGHPKRGGFLPPVPLPRRMWAGGRLTFGAPVPVEARIARRSTILGIESKVGRQGPLIFVTVGHVVSHGTAVCIEEEQDIVYRGNPRPAPPSAPTPSATSATSVPTAPNAPGATIGDGDRPGAEARQIAPDSTMLFRYSALTGNGHRIHYDRQYAREVEGYRDVVVHGPLSATLLMRFASELRGAPLRTFEFRGIQPMFVGEPITLEVEESSPNGMIVVARGPDGVGMRGTATFA